MNKDSFAVRTLGLIIYLLSLVVASSWTFRCSGDGCKQVFGGKVILAFWHGQYIPMLKLLKGSKACIFTADSFRGRVIGNISTRYGHDNVVLPETANLSKLRVMEQSLVNAELAALAVDGPLGPYHQVKPGILLLASALSWTVIPACAAVLFRLVLWKRWDRLEVPLPFSRILMVLMPPLNIPKDLCYQQINGWQKKLEDQLETACAEAESEILDSRWPRS